MDEAELLGAFHDAEKFAQNIGVSLVIREKVFVVLSSNGSEIYAKSKINGIIDFLRGYQCGRTMP